MDIVLDREKKIVLLKALKSGVLNSNDVEDWITICRDEEYRKFKSMTEEEMKSEIKRMLKACEE